MNIFLSNCPICGFPHDDGTLVKTKDNKGEERYFDICLDCMDFYSLKEIQTILKNKMDESCKNDK